jgi:hypothetical protein
MDAAKPRVIRDYTKLEKDILERIKLSYPEGFSDNLIYYTNKDGKKVSALPFETEDHYLLVRMTVLEAEQIIEDDDDYNDDGELRDSVRSKYHAKHGDEEEYDGVGEESDDDEDED